jgi:NADPH2:quinone reductase
MKARVARIEEHGAPNVIRWHDAEVGGPGPGQARIRHSAVGLNFIDIYHRCGIYPIELPSGLGLEAAGIVEAVGEGVADLAPGDRVATFGPDRGAYATARLVEASSLFSLPDDIDDETAAAVLLKGCTVELLVERCARVEAGWPVLVQAAAGGVGLLLVQWLKAVGALVIGTVSSEEKAEIARAGGADHVILYTHEDVGTRVRELTRGEGVRVTFDGVGKATFYGSVDATGSRGLIVSYGNASGTVGQVDFGILARKGSLFTTRPTLFDYYREQDERKHGAERVFEMIRRGILKANIGQRYPLEHAAQAQDDLEARRTTGSSILLP